MLGRTRAGRIYLPGSLTVQHQKNAKIAVKLLAKLVGPQDVSHKPNHIPAAFTDDFDFCLVPPPGGPEGESGLSFSSRIWGFGPDPGGVILLFL